MSKIKKQILVIDDDPKILEVVKAYLEAVDFDVIALNDPTQVEKVINGNFIDAVICDFLMPKRNGGDVLRIIRTYEKRKIPVIIISGDPTIGKDSTFTEGSMAFFMVKPVNFPKLIDLINRTLRRFQLVNIEDFEENEVEGTMQLIGESESFKINVVDYSEKRFSLESEREKAIRGEEYQINIVCKSDGNDVTLSFTGRVDEINNYGSEDEIVLTPLDLDRDGLKKLCASIELKQAYVAQFMNSAKGQ